VVEEIRRELVSVLLLNMEGKHAREPVLIRNLVTLNLVLLMEHGQSGLTGQHAQWTVVEETRRELVSVLLLNMEGKHVWAQLLISHHVTLTLVQLMGNGQVGLIGLHAQWTVVEETRRKLVSVLLLNMEETHARDQVLSRHPVTLNLVLLMESGQHGLNGASAQWSVVEETNTELVPVLLLNMEETHARTQAQLMSSQHVTLNLVLLMESGQSGLIGLNAQWTVVEDIKIELVSVLLLNMEEIHVWAQPLTRHPVTLNLALLMESGQSGLTGLHAQWSVVEETRVELVPVLLLNMEEKHVWAQLLIRHPVTLNLVQLMGSGQVGPTGLHAQWTVEEETGTELMSVLHLNMEENHARDQLLISHPVTLNLVLLMESGQYGLIGLHAQWTVEEETRRELESVLLLNMEEKHAWVQLLIINLVMLNLVLLMENGQPGLVGQHAQRTVVEETIIELESVLLLNMEENHVWAQLLISHPVTLNLVLLMEYIQVGPTGLTAQQSVAEETNIKLVCVLLLNMEEIHARGPILSSQLVILNLVQLMERGQPGPNGARVQ